MIMKTTISACVYNSPKNSTYTRVYDSNVTDKLAQQLKSSHFQISKSSLIQYLPVQDLNLLSYQKPILLKT